MDIGSLPDLPFKHYYQYLASFGAIVIIISLLLQPTFMSSKKLFEMGSIAIIFGIFGWLLEMFWHNLADNINMEWKHATYKAGPQQSPYEIFDVDRLKLTAFVSLSRMIMFGIFVFSEFMVYSSR